MSIDTAAVFHAKAIAQARRLGKIGIVTRA
jgi:hypothetical protein